MKTMSLAMTALPYLRDENKAAQLALHRWFATLYRP
jgi:hypothetical protein